MLKLLGITDIENSIGIKEIGNTNIFNYNGDCFSFGSILIGSVESISVIQEKVLVKTKEATYVFEKIIGETKC